MGTGSSSYTHMEAIPAGYPDISLEDLTEVQQDKTNLWLWFEPGMSPVVPKHYELRYAEYTGENPQHMNAYGSFNPYLVQKLKVNYYEAIHPYFAKIIFLGKSQEIFWTRSSLDIEEGIIDLWGADDLLLYEDRNTILVLRDNRVVFLTGDVDFNDKEVRELIIDKFF